MLASCLRTCVCTWMSSHTLPATLPTREQHRVVSLASKVCWTTQNGKVELAWVICTGGGMVAFLCEVLQDTVGVRYGSVWFVSTTAVLTTFLKGACAPVRTDGMIAGNVAVATNLVSGRSSYWEQHASVVHHVAHRISQLALRCESRVLWLRISTTLSSLYHAAQVKTAPPSR